MSIQKWPERPNRIEESINPAITMFRHLSPSIVVEASIVRNINIKHKHIKLIIEISS